MISCITSTNPETGEKQVSLDPNTVTNLQDIGETASTIMSILGVFWPALLPIAGYVAGAVRISRKLSPKLTEAQSETEMYHTAATSTVLGIEEFKKEFPNEWEKLASNLDKLKDKIIKPEDRLKIENLIRGLRGK
jgi:hypothetical protein